MNSSYINSRMSPHLLQGEAVMALVGAAPPQDLKKGRERSGSQPHLRPTPCRKAGVPGPQPLPPPSQELPTAQLTLLGLNHLGDQAWSWTAG